MGAQNLRGYKSAYFLQNGLIIRYMEKCVPCVKKRGEQAEEKAEYPKALFATPAASNPRAQDLPPLRPRAFARALPLER